MKELTLNPNAQAYTASRKAVRVLPENESLFGEALVAQRRTSISINSAYGISALRQNVALTGSGSTSTASAGKIILSTGATAGSISKLGSAEVGIYAPGFSAEIGIGVRPQSVLSGTAFARWGGISADNNNGLYFKLTAGGEIAAVRLKDGVEEDVIDRANWEIDAFDGDGPSEINITATQGYIYQIDFSWYGYGLIVFGIVRQMQDFKEVQHFIPGHVIQIEDDISISEPNLQIFAEIANGDQTTDYSLDIGGMQYSIVGINEGARKRTVDDFVSDVGSVSTTRVHLMSFRRKSSFVNRLFEVQEFEAAVASERVCFELWFGGTVTGGTYATPTGYSADETSIESVREQTFSTTGAVLLYRKFVEAGSANKAGDAASGIVDLNLPANGVLTLTARTLSGSAAVSYVALRGIEGW